MSYIENTLTVNGVLHTVKHLESQTLQNILDVNSGVNGNGLKSALIEYLYEDTKEVMQYNNFLNNDFLGEIIIAFILISYDLEGNILGSTNQLPKPVIGQDYLDWINQSIDYTKVNKSVINYMLNYAYGESNDEYKVYCFDQSLEFFQPIIFTCSQPFETNNLVITVTDSEGTLSYSLDGEIYQASNTFEGLEEGLKTVYVKDDNTVNTRTFLITSI